MFTKDQTISISRYFDMVSNKLLELYKQINKDDSSDSLRVDLGSGAVANLSFNSAGNIGLSYSVDTLDSCPIMVIFDNDSKLKQIYINADFCVLAFFDDDKIENFIVNNSIDLLTREGLLKKFNSSIVKYKNALQSVIDLLAVHCEVDGVSLDDFVMPDFVIENNAMIENVFPTTILAAAVRARGIITLGYCHSDCARSIGSEKYTVDASSDKKNNHDYAESGYITSDGNFVLSETAWHIALKNDLIDENVQCFQRNSEDFYRACGKHFDLMEAKKKIKERLENVSSDVKEYQKVNKD